MDMDLPLEKVHQLSDIVDNEKGIFFPCPVHFRIALSFASLYMVRGGVKLPWRDPRVACCRFLVPPGGMFLDRKIGNSLS